MKTLHRFIAATLCAALAAGCSSSRAGFTPVIQLNTPESISPALIAPAPMAKTSILPSSTMDVKPQSSIQGVSWTQLPGTASFVAAAPDGSIWALSDQPSGADKFIWHYANGTWTNISGMASRIAVAPDGTLYAINSGGGTYSYNGSTWTALGGGASDITVASDGTFYVLSNGAAAGKDQAIWHYSNGWTQVPGSGTRIAASWDTNSYSLSIGTISARGLYIINSAGGIYYENPNNSFVKLPGAASAIAPTTIGGVFVLGYPSNSNGNSIYYFDMSTGAWASQSGAGVSISAQASHLYVIGGNGGIYSSIVAATGAITITGIDNNAPTAMTPLHIATTGLGSGPITVTFSNGGNFVVQEAPISAAADGTLTVAVPLHMDPTTGQTSAVTANVSISQGASTSPAVSVAIQDIPQLSAYGTTLGSISRTFYNYQIITLGRQLGNLYGLENTKNNTAYVGQAITDTQTLLNDAIEARNDVDRIMTDNSVTIPVTSAGGSAVNYDKHSLELQDRIMGWYLVNLTGAMNSSSAPAARPVGFNNRLAQPSTSTLADTLVQLKTVVGAVQFTVDVKDSIAKNKPNDTILAVLGGVAVGAAALATVGVVAAPTAAVVAVGVTTLSIWNHVYNEVDDLGTIEHASERGTDPATVAAAEKDMSDQRNKALLDGVDLVIGGLNNAEKSLFQTIEGEAGSYGVTEAADYLKSVIMLGTSTQPDGDLAETQNAAAEVATAYTSGSPDYFGDVTGTATITNSNGNGSLLKGLDGIQIDDNVTNYIISSTMDDSSGNYDVLVPLGSSSVHYSNLRVQAYDPIANIGTGYVNIDLSSLNAGGTSVQIPTFTGSCNDTDAGSPDADDPDCD